MTQCKKFSDVQVLKAAIAGPVILISFVTESMKSLKLSRENSGNKVFNTIVNAYFEIV